MVDGREVPALATIDPDGDSIVLEEGNGVVFENGSEGIDVAGKDVGVKRGVDKPAAVSQTGELVEGIKDTDDTALVIRDRDNFGFG